MHTGVCSFYDGWFILIARHLDAVVEEIESVLQSFHYESSIKQNLFYMRLRVIYQLSRGHIQYDGSDN